MPPLSPITATTDDSLEDSIVSILCMCNFVYIRTVGNVRYVTSCLWQQLYSLKVAKIGNFRQPKIGNKCTFFYKR